MLDPKAAILRGAEVYDAQTRLDNGKRALYLNASEADSCIRMQWYKKNEPSRAAEQSWGMARRGTHMEKYMVERLKIANVPLMYALDEQENIVDHEYPISATPDGEILDEELDMVTMIEFKTIDPRANKTRLPKPGHVTQVQLAMDLRQRLGEETVAGAWLIYMDASDYDDISAHWIPYKPGVVKLYAPRAKRLLSARAAGALPAEGTANGDCRYCPFSHICDGGKGTGPAVERVTKAAAEGLGQMVDRIESLDKIVEEHGQLKKDLKEAMLKGKQNWVEGTNSVASISERSGRESFDRAAAQKAAEAAGLDLRAFTSTGAPSTVLTIKKKET